MDGVTGFPDPLPPVDLGHWASAIGDGIGDRGGWGIYSDWCHLWLVCDAGPCHNFSLEAPAMSHPLFSCPFSPRDSAGCCSIPVILNTVPHLYK